MKRINLLFILFTIFTISCKKHKCDDYSCFTPPNFFNFDIVDKTTGENLFTNGTYNESDVEITNLLDSTIYEYYNFNEYATNWLIFNGIGWQSEIVSLSVSIDGNHIFNFYVDAERKEENCCSFTEYHEINIDSTEYELNTNSGLYKIFVE
ncbi:MAG: hypothetical protein H6553_12975 [Chitinophagales bacterium]|nr:hypothetical protein [Chitinophagales bacterium]